MDDAVIFTDADLKTTFNREKKPPPPKGDRSTMTEEEMASLKEIGFRNMVLYWERELRAIHRGIPFRELGFTVSTMIKLHREGYIEENHTPTMRWGKKCWWSLTPRARAILRGKTPDDSEKLQGM